MKICNDSVISLFSLLVFSVSGIVFADNPIISHKYTADPNAMVWDGRVYVYCSRDDNNSDAYDIVDYTLISSDDMANWTDHGEVFKVPRDASWANRAYAPGCVERDGKFFLYFPDGGSSIGVAVGDKPEGPFKDALGKAIVSKSMPNCDVEWLFDPAAFIDDDGQAYLYFGGGQNTAGTNLRVIKLNSDMISTSGTAVTISAPKSFEASFLHKYSDKYYFSYSTDFSNGAAKIDYMISDNPMTGFVHKGTVLPNPSKNMGNNNHASIIEFSDKTYIFYHDRSTSNETYKRSVNVDIVTYNSDGTMKQTTPTTAGPSQIKNLNPYDTVQAETMNKQKGIKTDVCSEGGIMLTGIAEGDYTNVSGVDFGAGATKFEVQAASGTSGGKIELHIGSATGTLAGTCTIDGTGSWTTWKTFSCDVSGCSGVKDLYLVFKGSGEPFRLNWYLFSDGKTGIKTSETCNSAKTNNRSWHIVSAQNKSGIAGATSVHDISGRTVEKRRISGKKDVGVYILK